MKPPSIMLQHPIIRGFHALLLKCFILTFVLFAPNVYAATYYYESGDPALPGSWGTTSGVGLGIAATNFTTSTDVFIVENGFTTAAATANIAISAGVTLQVENGGTLNMAGFSVTGAGNFDLQAGGTLQAANATGFNGGAINNSGTRTWNTGANYIFAPTVANCLLNIATAQVNNLTTIAAAGNVRISPNLTVNGTFTGGSWINVNCGNNLTLAAGAHTSSGGMWLGSPNSLTVNGTLTFTAGAALSLVGTSGCGSNGSVNGTGSVTYNAGAALQLVSGWTGTATSTILPAVMDGDVIINGTATISATSQINGSLTVAGGTTTLNAPVTVAGTLAMTGGVINSAAVNMLTVSNTTSGAITGGSATSYVDGPMRRNIPAGGPTASTWLFPVGKGGTYLPFAIQDPTTVGGATIEAEAFNAASGGTGDGSTITTLSATEYWLASVAAGSFTSGLVQVGKTGLTASNIIGSSTVLAGVYASNGANTFSAGTPPTLTRTVTDNFAAPMYFAVGTGPLTYYYESGDPALPGSWGTTSGAGLGTAATNFTTSGDIFIVEASSPTTAAGSSFTLGAGVTMTVQNGCTLVIASTFTMTNNGTLNIAGGGTLNLQGTGAISAASTNPVTYQALNSVLMFSGGASKTVNAREWHTPTMAASVTLNNTFIITLPHSSVVTGTFTANQRLNLSGAGTTLTLNADIVFGASGEINSVGAAQTVVVAGTGTVTGNFDIGGGSVYPGNLTLNRAGMILQMRGNRSLSGILDLTAGILKIQPGANWFAQYNSTPGGIINASATSYIDVSGSAGLYLRLPASMVLGPTYTAPIGTSTQYMPVDLLTPTTGGSAYFATFNASNTGQVGGVPDCSTITSLNSTESWHVGNTGGGTLTAGISLTASSVNASTLIGFKKTSAAGTYQSIGAVSVLGSTVTYSTPFSFDATSDDNFFNLGNNAAPAVYTFTGGDPNILANWMPLPASFSVQCAQYVIPNGQTATLTANLTIGSGSSGSKFIVQSGGTLDCDALFGLSIGGNNGAFILQAGGTIRARKGAGINGSSNGQGCVQISAASPGTVTITYDPAANYSFSPTGGAAFARFGAAGNKPAITVANNILLDGPANVTIETNLTVNGNFIINASAAAGGFTLSGASPQILSLNAAANQIQAGHLTIGANFTLANPNVGGLTVLSGANVNIDNATVPFVTGNEFVYNAGSTLTYQNTTPVTTGLEFPVTMNGNVTVNAGGGTPTVTLNAARTLGASSTLTLTAGRLVTSVANMLTVNNTAVAAVTRTNGMVEGPMRRALPAGGPTAGTWLFPVSKGGTYLPFAVQNPTTAGGATVEAEVFNAASGGTADGSTMTALSATEYWSASVAAGSFTNGFMQVGKTGLTAANIIGSSTVLAGTYASNGANTFAAGTPPTLTRTVTDNLAAPTYFAVGSTIVPAPTILAYAPARNLNTSAPLANITLTWSANVTAATAAVNVMKVHGGMTGRLAGAYSQPALNQSQLDPTFAFKRGELISVTVTHAQASPSSASSRPQVYQFRASAGVGPGTFYPTGTLPKIDNNAFVFVATGDLDGDGDLDLVSTNAAGIAAHIQTGVNSGVYTLSAAFGWGFGATQARMVKLADVNNDGNLDALALHAYTPSVLVVWLGNGAGSFGAASSYPVTGASDTGALTVADLDGDGDLDVASSDFTATSMNVMLNNGSGAFSVAPGSPFTVGTISTAIEAGDIDGDGDIDLVGCANNQVWVMVNNGLASFYARTGSPYTIGGNNQVITLGDVNADGTLDIVIVRESPSNAIEVRLNDGTGGYATSAAGSPYAYPVGSYIKTTLADADGDGDMDILVCDPGNLRVLTNSAGSFSLSAASPFPSYAGNSWGIVSGDADGDGDMDAMIVTDNPASIILLKNGTQPVLTTFAPTRNTNTAALAASISPTFNQTMTTATAAVNALKVWGGFTGLKAGVYSGGGTATPSLAPTTAFRPGEQVWVTVTQAQTSLAGSVGIAARPTVYGFRTQAGVGPATFFNTLSFGGTGLSSSEGMVAADLNNDGQPDLVTINQTSTITVCTNTGGGNFSTGTTYAIPGATGRAICAGDFNNDGFVDIAVCNDGAGTVYVLLNNGAGAFPGAVTYSPGGGHLRGITTADFDGDGDLDIAASRFSANDVVLLINSGAGVFSVGAATAVGASPMGITAGDLDNDGDIDMAIANSGGTTVSILLNNGYGGFTAGTALTVGTTPEAVVLGAFDGDNYLDLAVANSASNNVSILLNLATGAATFAGAVNVAVNLTPKGLVSGDFDGDGDLDLAAPSFASPYNTSILTNAAGVFTLTQSAPASATHFWAITAGDWDGDGDIDLAAVDEWFGQVCILKNGYQPVVTTLAPTRHSNTAALGAAVSPTYNQIMMPGTASAAVMKVFGGFTGLKAGAYSGGGTATPSLAPTVPFRAGEQVWVTVTNARTNLVGSVNIPARPLVYGFRAAAGVGPAQFIPGAAIPAGLVVRRVAAGDVNNDGLMDIIAASDGSSQVSVMRNLGGGTSFSAPAVSSVGMNGGCPVLGDFNNDGWIDIATANYGANNVSVLLNSGTGTFPGAGTNYGSGGVQPNMLVTGDVNGDGNLDIITANTASNTLAVLLGTGTGTFGVATTYGTGASPFSLTAGDFDNDGDLDIALGSFTTNVYIMQNDGTGVFTLFGTYGVSFNNSLNLHAVRMDADGNLDLVVGTGGGTNVTVLQGLGTCAFVLASNNALTANANGTAVGDFDGNGQMDVVAGAGTGNMAYLGGNGTLTLTAAVNTVIAGNNLNDGMVVADFDGDGDVDVLAALSSGNAAQILFNYLPFNVTNNYPPFGIPPVTPTFNTMNAALATNVVIPFNQNLNVGTVNATNFRVHGALRGMRSATYGVAPANTATLTGITSSFLPNERVFVTVTNAQSSGGTPTRPFVMSFRAASGLAPGSFYQTTAVSSAAPKRVVYGHFNADAFVDMAVVGTGGIELFTGAATGLFTSAGMIAGSAGTSYFALATADMDNNGTLDIIGGYNDATRTVRVFTNSGAAVFTPLAPLAGIGVAANNINDLAVADFNADGLPDVAVVCGGVVANGNYAVLRNTGGGVLAVQQTASSPNIYGVDVGDIDGDGDIDIAYTRWNAGVVFTLINDGNSNFSAEQTLTTGTDARSVRLGDVNNDGRLDLVVVQGGPSNLLIFLNSGTAITYPTLPSQTVAFGAWATDVQLFDADADNFLDAVATEDVGGRLIFFKNNAGTFAAPTPIYNFPNLLYLAAADIDNDGDVDLAASANNGSVHVLKYGSQPVLTTLAPTRNTNTAAVGAAISPTFNQTMTTATASVNAFKVWGGFTGLKAGTYSGGGGTTPSLAPTVPFRAGEQVWVTVTQAQTSLAGSVGIAARPQVYGFRTAAGVGPATFVQTQLVAGGGGNTRHVVAADWNNNGTLDLVMINQNGANNIRQMTNVGGIFTPQAPIATTFPSVGVPGDFDNDGDMDLAVSNIGASTVTIFQNMGGVLAAFGTVTGLGGLDHIASADFDGDGLLDIVAACGVSGVRVARNTGALSFATYQTIAVPQATACTTGDFDNDGDMDIVYSTNAGNTVCFLTNDGYGNFSTTPVVIAAGNTPYYLGVGDLDNDGDLDVVVSNTNSGAALTILENTSMGGILSFTTFTRTVPCLDVVVADYNGDGSLDIAAISGATASIFLNTGAGILTGRFAAAPNSTTVMTGVGSFAGTAGDWDGDGDIDLAAANHTSGDVSILFNMLPPTTYYYQSGDAGLPANWNSLPWGGGFAATAFTSPASDFYVMGSNPAGAVTTATVTTSFTIGANVSLHVTTPSVLAVNNGVTITNNGFLNVSGNTVAGSTLRLTSTGAVAGNPVTYWGTTATLEYDGAGLKISSLIELPAVMPGSLVINKTAPIPTFALGANTQINGTLTAQAGTFDISGRTLQANGAMVFSGGTINASATATLDIAGTGNITGPALFTGILGSLTMNRAAATLSLGSPLDISGAGLLSLSQGFIQTTPTNILRTTNTAAGAIVGGSAASHIVGPLRRFLPAGGGTFTYPVGGGSAATYIPVSVNYASAAGVASYEVEPLLTGSGGTETGLLGAGTLSTTEYWRTALGGFALNTVTLTFTRTTPALIATNRIGESATAGGTYTGINSNDLMGSAVAAPNISNVTAFAPLNPGTMFYAIGGAAAPPLVTALSPTRNNPSAAPLTSPINVTFSQTLTALTMRSWGGMTGLLAAASGVGTNTGTVTGNNFKPGEKVQTTVMTGTSSAAGFMTAPHVYEFMAQAGVGPATFYRTSAIAVGIQAHGCASGDFNGDGNLDVAVAKGSGNGVDVFMSTGTDSFAPAAYYATGLQPEYVVAGDFNNDGRLDLAVPNANGNNVSILMNTGAGTFLPAVNYGTGNFPKGTAVADFNGDGFMDIITANFSGAPANGMSVLLNTGTGTFFPAVNYATGGAFVQLCRAGDFDGDGDIDVVIANQPGNTFGIHRNNGNGTFAPVVTTGSPNPWDAFPGDLDGDGDLDLAVPDATNNAVRIYFNNGAGVFAFGATYPSGGIYPTFVTVADFNGDGLLDVAAANSAGNNLGVLLNTGAGVFAPVMNYPTGTNPTYSVSGDFDGDGDLDLVVSNQSVGTISIMKNGYQPVLTTLAPTRNTNTAAVGAAISPTYNQTMTTATAAVNTLKVWGGFTGLKAGTYSGGGGTTPSLAPTVPFRPGEQVWVTVTQAQTGLAGSVGIAARPLVYGFRAHAGVGPATFQQTSAPAVGTNPRFIATGDFDGDGDLDLVVTNTSGANTVSILLNSGAGSYAAAVNYAVGTNPQSIAVGDFDNNGTVDLAVANDGSNNVSILMNAGGGTFAAAVNYGVGATPQMVVTGDFDGDGTLDLATANLGGNNVSVLLNTGLGTFAAAVPYAAGINPESLATGDFDNDGDLDLATANYSANNVSILLNTGLGTYLAPANYAVGTQPNSITAGDLDADGDIDLIAANIGGNTVSVLLNTGAGVYAAAVNYPVGSGPASVTTGDFDGDGDLDLVTANTGGSNDASILLNTGSGAFAAAVNYAAGNQPFSVTTGDVDGDGDMDVATANFASNDVSILFNTNPAVRAGFGQALSLNGTTQYGDAGNVIQAPALTNTMTFEAWVNPSAYPAGLAQITGKNNVVSFGINNAGRLAFRFGDGTGWTTPTHTSTIAAPLNTWTHLAAVYNGTTVQLFVNGVISGSFAQTGSIGANAAIHTLGALSGLSEFYQGTLDEVRIWNSALPQTTINTYRGVEISTTHPNWANLLGYWKFNEYSGTTAIETKSALNATLVNNPARVLSTTTCSMIAHATGGAGTAVDLPAMSLGITTYSLVGVNGGAALGSIFLSGNVATYTPINSVSAGATDLFTYQVTDGTTVSTATVRVEYRPLITALAQTVPASVPTMLATAVSANGGMLPLSWLWAPAAGLSSAVVQIPTVTTAAPIVYTVSLTDAYGFITTGTVNVGIIGTLQITNYSPIRNSYGSATSSAPRIVLSDVASTATLRVHGELGGERTTVLSIAGSTVTATPTRQALPGELMSVSITQAQGVGGAQLIPTQVYEYRARATGGAGQYYAAATPAVGAAPTALLVADINQDGKADLITANRNANSLTVLRAVSPGIYTTAGTISTGLAPASLAGGDWDRDGDLDLAVATTGASVIMLYDNAGGVFTHTTNLATGGPVRAVAAGDLNGDGYRDVVALTQAGQINLFFGGVGAVFATGPVSATGLTGGDALAIADVDQDGDLDVVVVQRTTGTNLSILRNAGNTGMLSATTMSAGMYPSALAAGDLDADGDADLALLSAGDNTVVMLMNNGAGVFTSGTPLVVEGLAAGLAVTDVEGDGDLDLAVSSVSGTTSGIVRIYTNVSGVYTPGFRAITGSGAGAIVSGDMDGDLDLDLLVAHNTNATVSALRNQPPPQLTVTPNPVDLGQILVGARADVDVTIDGINLVGESSLSVSSATWSLSAPGMVFTTQAVVSVAQQPDFSTTLRVRFAPVTTGTATGNLLMNTPFYSGMASLIGVGVQNVPAPVVLGLGSTTACAGSQVFISGQNLSAATVVTIGGVPTTQFTVVSSAGISVEVPLSLQGTQLVVVQVTTPGGTGGTSATLHIPYTPTITSLSPLTGATGATLRLKGTNFELLQSVQFGVTGATYRFISPTELEVTVPPNISLVGVQQISVQTLCGRATSSAVFTYSGGGITTPAPQIGSIQPMATMTGGSIIITGTNLAGAIVTIGGVPAQVNTNTAGELTVTVPAGLTTSSPEIRVTTAGGTTTATGSLVVFAEALPPKPQITNVSPTTTGEGGEIVVTGSYLADVQQIVLQSGAISTFATYRVLNATQISVTIPPGFRALVPTGSETTTASLTVVTRGGSATTTSTLSIVSRPVITSISPNGGAPGTKVIITGENLSSITTATLVGTTSSVGVSFRVISPTQVELIIPPVTTGSMTGFSGFVSLSGPGGVVTSATMVNPQNVPVITSFSPTSGVAGNRIIITGEHLSSANLVTIGGIPVARVEIVSPTQIAVTLGTGGSRTATGTVVVQTPSGVATAPGVFQFIESLERDVEILLHLKSVTGGSAWRGVPNGWVTGIPVEVWSGVQVSGNRVTSLQLGGKNLTGELPPQLGGLSGLVELNVSNNNLSGGLPDSLRNLKRLQIVRMNNNKFRRGVEMLCFWPDIRLVDFSVNEIEAEIPRCVGDLRQLEFLDIHNNKFFGILPVEMARLERLAEFNAADNRLEGAIPREFGVASPKPGKAVRAQTAGLSGLVKFNVGKNRMSGALPQEFGNLTQMQELRLEGNSFSGRVPELWTKLRNLSVLSLASNRLTAVPDLSVIRTLDTIRVENNRLDFGSIEALVDVETHSYSPQDSIGSGLDTAVAVGSRVVIPVLTGGRANEYQWFKREEEIGLEGKRAVRWVAVRGATGATMVLESFSPSDSGRYELRVKNDVADKLTLYTRGMTIRPLGGGIVPQIRLISPVNTATLVPRAPVYRWRRAAEASWYQVEISRTADFSDILSRGTAQAQATDTIRWAHPVAEAMEFGEQYYWRVRGYNNNGGGAWSEVWTFRVVSEGVDLALSTVDFGLVPLGDKLRRMMAVQNVSGKTLTLTNLKAANNAFEVLTQINSLRLIANEERLVEVEFSPRVLYGAQSAVDVEYTLVGSTVSRLDGVLRGTGGAVKVVDVDFDTVRVGRTTVAGSMIINRSGVPVELRNMQALVGDGADTTGVVDPTMQATGLEQSVWIGSGDTVAVALRHTASEVGARRSRLVVVAASGTALEKATAQVQAVARFPRTDDVVLVPGIRAERDNLTPGETVKLQIYIHEGNREKIFQAGQPQFQGIIRFNRGVLYPEQVGGTAQLLRSSDQRSVNIFVNIPPQLWGRRDTVVLLEVPCRIVLGDVDSTRLEIVSFTWGNVIDQMRIGGQKVFVEEPQNGVFHAGICRIDGVARLITSSTKFTTIQSITPNPATDDILVNYTLREQSALRLEVVDISGRVVRTLVEGVQQAGEYSLQSRLEALPAGAYQLRLSTPTAGRTAVFQVVR